MLLQQAFFFKELFFSILNYFLRINSKHLNFWIRERKIRTV